MKKRVLLSAMLAGVLVLSGCGSKDGPGATPGDGSGTPVAENEGAVKVTNDSGATVDTVDPTEGATVIISRNNDGTNNVATVVRAELNKCNGVDTLGSRVACGPKEEVTYVFQSDFGKLGGTDGNGDIDNNSSTPDGGVLLYDALTVYNGKQYDTPIEGNSAENRIQEVYIPSNYIVLDDQAQDASNNEKYEYMREYLANAFNMQCIASEPSNNPYFTDGKTEGDFVATYVMHFTRGTGESTLLEKFKTDTTDLEYLTVSFHLNVAQVDGNSSKLRFSSPAGSPVVFGAKKAGDTDGLMIPTTNIELNSILHESQTYVDSGFTINMAKYFDKLIAKGDSLGVSDFAKDILVENASNPWPVKMYGTLHEITGADYSSFDRSFVRNPAELNASLFNLDAAGPYAGAFALTNGNTNQATKFNIVYPGGVYNKID